MSHHVSASPSNPTGAVEVVRTASSAATTAPVDTGSAAGAGAVGAVAPASSSQPVSALVGGAPAPAAGLSGTPGANLPVPNIEQASNTIEGARADLSRTAGAERRLDGFDLVGGGGGGGGGGAEAGVADEGAQDAVAAGTDGLDVSETGLGGARMELGQGAELTSGPEQGANPDAVRSLAAEQTANAEAIQSLAANQAATESAASGAAGQQTDPRSVL